MALAEAEGEARPVPDRSRLGVAAPDHPPDGVGDAVPVPDAAGDGLRDGLRDFVPGGAPERVGDAEGGVPDGGAVAGRVPWGVLERVAVCEADADGDWVRVRVPAWNREADAEGVQEADPPPEAEGDPEAVDVHPPVTVQDRTCALCVGLAVEDAEQPWDWLRLAVVLVLRLPELPDGLPV